MTCSRHDSNILLRIMILTVRETHLVLRLCLDIQFNHVVSEMFNSIEIAITKTLRIQKKEGTKDKKNTLYIVVTQIDVSLKENMLKHKKDVDLKDVYDTKKCVCHRNLLITRNTKKCVCLKDNRSWLENAREEKRCWIISESNLNQI